MDEPRADSADYLEQKRREPRQRIIAASKNPHIGPRIEIVFDRQQEELLVSAPGAKLGAIGVLLPANATQQFAIGGMESDEVAAAAVVRPEDEFLRRQLCESALDVGCPKPRTIPTDCDDFVVAELGHRLDRVFESLGKTAAGLAMNSWIGNARGASGREKMNVARGRKFSRKRGKTQKRPGRNRERAPRQIDMRLLGEEENGAPGHAFGYKTAGRADKPFLNRRECARFSRAERCFGFRPETLCSIL